MKKALKISLNSCFSKLTKPACNKPSIHLWLLSCRKLLTSPPSERPSAGIGLSHVDRYLFENFPSLYNRDDNDDDSDDICWACYISRPTDVSPKLTSPPPHAVRASERFFVAPGATSSLVEEARPGAAASCSGTCCPSDGTAAVTTFSGEPYRDFLQSMMEMVEARRGGSEEDRLDWEFLEELLFCYLELNDRSVHKDILRAFTDLIASLICRMKR